MGCQETCRCQAWCVRSGGVNKASYCSGLVLSRTSTEIVEVEARSQEVRKEIHKNWGQM